MEKFLEIAKNAFPLMEGSEKLIGLHEEVEIFWDRWGIPHIYGNFIEDIYFSLGYIHARHRLWQMELLRRLTAGELSEITGEASIDSDKYFKTIGFHRLAQKSVKRISKKKNSELYRWVEAYVKGVNAGIQKARKNPPLEFAVLQLKIKEWTLEDSFKIVFFIDWNNANWNYPLELLREQLITKLGIETADKIIPFYSAINIKNGVGSNGWAVSPRKSESGAVLFANDPHLSLTVPTLWYLTHLNCPGLNVIGSTLPGLPMIVLGHNEKIAWGCTNVHSDTIDLFKMEINPKNNNQYKYNDQWIDFEIINEPIRVRGKETPLSVKVLTTKFGPIIDYFEVDGNFYKINLPSKYALRWSSFEADLEETVDAFNQLNKASNWNEFQTSLSELVLNLQNFIYGDVDGNIGLQHGGKIPVRRFGDGATVTPGVDEKYNWERLSTFEEMFSLYNPDCGFVYNANYNEDKAPKGLLLAQDRTDSYRQFRIKKLLQSKEKFSLQDFIRFQLDYYTGEPSELLPLLLKYLKSNKIPNEYSNLIHLLENWDYILTRTTIAGTIYKVWVEETIKAILIPLMGEEMFKPFIGPCPFDLKRLFTLYEENVNELEKLIFKSFQNTINFLSKKISPDYNKWEWGNLHKLSLVHPFSFGNKDAEILNIGIFKIGGDTSTLNNGYYSSLNDYKVFVGPSFRQIYDLSDWDKSICILPGGQSGLPFHKHYKDLIKLYVKGQYIPMLFTKDAISKNLEGVLKLLPQ